MNSENALEILKKAILLEKRGNVFYRQAADGAGDEGVRHFFEAMALEEKKHIDVLSDQYKNYLVRQRFDPASLKRDENVDLTEGVLTKDLQQRISAAGFEAAAISAAMALEERAIKLYAGRAAAGSGPAEKALYEWLADWERAHLKMLTAIDRQLTESIWFDNEFWPF